VTEALSDAISGGFDDGVQLPQWLARLRNFANRFWLSCAGNARMRRYGKSIVSPTRVWSVGPKRRGTSQSAGGRLLPGCRFEQAVLLTKAG
jgi:hypothetical protein